MRNPTFRRSLTAGSAAAIALAVFSAPTMVAAQAATYSFDIPAQDLSAALRAFGRAARQQVVFDSQDTRGKRSSALVGTFTADAGLQQLLGGTGLTVRRGTSGVLIVSGPQALGQNRPLPDADEQAAVLPEILVEGGGSLNTDVRRSEDGILPYVVFGREEIQQSQAANVEDFLRRRLSMATDRGTAARNDTALSTSGNRSSFNLRGLGANQTLILVNGRRSTGVIPEFGADLAQPDINGIPISSIERIEVLPGSASGIYGGGATGGVINIILRKDYSGTELQLTYDNTFDTDSARVRADLTTGFSLEGGRTQVMLSGSYSDGNDLLAADRGFIERARQRAYLLAPDLFTGTDVASNGVNFRGLFGTPLILRNGTPYGAVFGTVPTGYVGGDAGLGLRAGAGTLNTSVPDGPIGLRQSLTAVPENQAVNLTIRRDMTDAVEAYLDLSATRSKSMIVRGFPGQVLSLAPGGANPFLDFVTVTLPPPQLDTETVTESGTQRVNGGLIIDLSHGWTAGLDANWNRATNAYTVDNRRLDTSLLAAAVAAGQIDPFRDPRQFPIDYTPYIRQAEAVFPSAPSYTEDYTARVAGPLFSLPAGQVRMTGLVSHRQEEAGGILSESTSTPRYTYYNPRTRDVNSAYVETVLPLVSEAQNVPLVHALEAQLSARWDHYETTTSAGVRFAALTDPRPAPAEVTTTLESTDYTVGFKYSPFADLSLRASYATGFLPPSLTQLLGFTSQSTNVYADPLRGNTRAFNQLALTSGGNANAKPEQSTSETIGLIYTPSFIDGLRLSVDFFRIDKTDELTNLDALVIIQNEALFPGRVTRGAKLPGDPASYAGVITALDISLLNAARTRVEATDIQIDYTRDIGDYGWFRVYAVGTIQSTTERQLLSSLPTIDRVGFSDGPEELRFNAGVDWRRGPWTLALNTQYYDEYKVYSSTDAAFGQDRTTRIQGSSTIPSQTYTDVSGRYDFDGGWLDGSQISFGVRNVFNQTPPVVATMDPVGGYSRFGDPRLRTYVISIRKSF